VLGLVACVVTLASGCGRPAATVTEPLPPATADGVLQAAVAAYQAADAYQDHGVVRLSYRREGRMFEDSAPIAVTWQRPNRLRVQAYQVTLACDGQTLRARIADEGTRDFDGQVVERAAPERLTLGDLYEHDEVLALAFRQGLAGYPLQLDLLLSPDPLASLRGVQTPRELLEPADLDGRACDRVRVETTDGPFVVWIDGATRLVRRIEYPAATFAAEIAADQTVDDVRLTADFRGATFSGPLPPTAFALDVSPQSRRVKKFIPPPQEMPSSLIGQQVGAFAFADLQGQTVTQESLADRIKVLMWFNNHPACQTSVRQLNEVFEQYKAQSRVAIYAVCVEPSTVTDSQLEQLLKLWRVSLPTVRDVQACGRDTFQIPWAPTLVVLDDQNVLQIFEVGANPNLVAELPQVLQRLIAGENLAQGILDQFRAARESYERALARGEPDAQPADTAPPTPQPTQPQLLRLEPAWTQQELKAAGNILAVTDATHDSYYLVFDGWRTIVHLDSSGELVAAHTLDLPEMAGVSQLQSATTSQHQRYFVAWSLRSPQAHVFDDQWRRVLSYPPTTVEHEGVQDAALADLDADGQLELCVGFWGTAGVHCVAVDGNVLWTNQTLPHVSSLAVVPPTDTAAAKTIWVAAAGGQVMALDARGQATPPATQPAELIQHVFSLGTEATSATPCCGIAYGTEGRRLALGLTTEPSTQWRYNLPIGSFPSQVRFVTAAPLLDSGEDQWLIAGPEGSLHIISQDGRFTDSFQTGRNLAGLAGGRRGAHGLLVISSEQGVRAWQVSPPTTAARH